MGNIRDPGIGGRRGRTILVVVSVALLGAGGIGFEGGRLLLTRPAGKLPTLMPGYIPGSAARHNPRYGHDIQTVALAMIAAGVAFGLLVLGLAWADRGGDVARAARRLGAYGRFVGLTKSGQEIILVNGHRLVYRRRGGYWRPRITCPTCDRERTSATVKIASAEDLAQLGQRSARECTSCQRANRVSLVAEAD